METWRATMALRWVETNPNSAGPVIRGESYAKKGVVYFSPSYKLQQAWESDKGEIVWCDIKIDETKGGEK